jgi:hypothetical protein
MSDLKDLVIHAHGGIERWRNVKTIEGDMSITGMTWARKGWPDVLKAAHVAVRTQSQWTSYSSFIREDQRSVCTPDHTIIEANERPGLANHEPQPTAERFVDLLFPQTAGLRSAP